MICGRYRGSIHDPKIYQIYNMLTAGISIRGLCAVPGEKRNSLALAQLIRLLVTDLASAGGGDLKS